MTNEWGQQVVLEGGVSEDVMAEFSATIDEVMAKQRDPSIPAGEFLGEHELRDGQGSRVRHYKNKSMVSHNGVPLPERVPLYHRDNNEVSMVPTAQLIQQLSKTNANGERVYSRQPWPGVAEPEYIYKEVPTLMGRPVMKRFYNSDGAGEARWRQLMIDKHTTHWEQMQEDARRAEREEDRAEQRALAQALLAAAGSTQGPDPRLSLIDHLNAEGLRALADEFGVELSDRRSVEKMRDEIREAVQA